MVVESSGVFLVQLLMQLVDLLPGFFQRPFSRGSDPVNSSASSLGTIECRAQQA